VIDARTLEVTLEKPTPFFLALLDTPPLFPLHQATLEKFKDRWTLAGNMISNGPFKLSSWQDKSALVMEKNPRYWDAAAVKLDEVNVTLTDSPATDERLFRTGKIDWLLQVLPEKLDYWREDKSFRSDPQLAVVMLKVNVTKAPLDDKRVRQALSLAIDRERLVKFVTKGGELPAATFTPPYTHGFHGESGGGGADPETARAALAAAGFKGGAGFPKIELLTGSASGHAISEAIQFMWKQTLGIDVAIHKEELRVYLNTVRTLSYQVAAASWHADYNDPNTFLDLLTTGNGNNSTGYANAAYDAAVAKREFDAAEKILKEDLPFIPLYFKRRNYLLSPRVSGWHANADDIHPLKYVSVAPR
jgi:oligopeptide transport system substrate-binding protein